MIGGGFAYKTCECEDFPCCGHNDVDPSWEPDPYDMDEDYYDEDEDADDDTGAVVREDFGYFGDEAFCGE